MTKPSLRVRLIDHLTIWLSDHIGRFAETEPSRQRGLAMLLDAALCVVATYLAFALRLGLVSFPVLPFLIVLTSAAISWALVARWLGFYRSMLRFSGGRTMVDLIWAAAVMGVAMSALFIVVRVDSLPRTMGVLQPMTFVGLIGMSRLAVRFLLVDFAPRSAQAEERNVLIYGAGRAGQQLALATRHEPHIRIYGYLDDDWRLHGQRIDGKLIHDPAKLDDILHKWPIDEVLLALPTATRERRREIVEALQPSGVSVRSLPSTAEIIVGEVSIDDLREVQIEDLLGRDPVPPNELLLSKNITDKVVLVTGAGGSIGSELCRQILRSRPRSLVMVDHAEFALYSIGEDLRESEALGSCELVLSLCNITDGEAVGRVFAETRPDTVFHAAAYKHVPLLEANPVTGAFNNIVGTLNCCRAAEAAGVGSFILVSTDKAVRPANVMGASKRVCEMILQARAALSAKTLFTMVRFGNVLGSSGSVIPRFKAQISAGGPVTVTHREMTRYFMTIPEAAQLVIQAGAMAKGGDVFVLDMGEPVKIMDLARTLIRLSDRTVRDENCPSGEIEIVEVGLRAGEKLYEELLIGNDPQPTLHPRIIKAHEAFLVWDRLEPRLEALRNAAASGDSPQLIALLRELVPDFVPAENAPPHHRLGTHR